MRILKGNYRGVELSAPADGSVRPTVDRIKKHLHGWLQELSPQSMWDLFAGCGGVGLEALSLNVNDVVFVEHAKSAIHHLQLNLSICRLHNLSVYEQQQIQVVHSNVDNFLKASVGVRPIKAPHLIFLDPPYGHHFVLKTIQVVASNRKKFPDTHVWIEHVVDEGIYPLPPGIQMVRQEQWGPKQLSWLCVD